MEKRRGFSAFAGTGTVKVFSVPDKMSVLCAQVYQHSVLSGKAGNMVYWDSEACSFQRVLPYMHENFEIKQIENEQVKKYAY